MITQSKNKEKNNKITQMQNNTTKYNETKIKIKKLNRKKD